MSYFLALIASVIESDATLAGRIAAGDQAALRRLFDRLGGRVRAVGLRVLGNPAEADDLLQDCFLQIWRVAGEYDHERGALATWVLTLAHRRAVDRLRRRATRPLGDPAAAVEPVAAGADPHESAADAQVRGSVVRALGTLAPEQRVPLELMYYRGLSQREAADELGVALGTLKSRVRAGMARLAGLLDELHAEEP